MTGEVEARVIALACSEAARAGAVDAAVVGETGGPDRGDTADGSLHDRAGPKEGALKHHLKACWTTIPPHQNAAFVAAMENVLGVYARPHNPVFPVVVMGKEPLQLLADAHPGTPAAPGRVAREDSE